MLTIGNIQETKKALEEYVAHGDYSQSFVIAGWKGLNKTNLPKEIDMKESIKVAKYNLSGKQSDELAKECSDILKIAKVKRDEPTYVVIDCNLESSLRSLLKNGLDIHLLRYDEKEWGVNKDGLSDQERDLYQDLSQIIYPQHPKVKKLENVKGQINDLSLQVQMELAHLNEDVRNRDVPKMLKKLNELYAIQYLVSIAKNDVKQIWDNIRENAESSRASEEWISNEELVASETYDSEIEKEKALEEARKMDGEEQEELNKIYSEINSCLVEIEKKIEEDFF